MKKFIFIFFLITNIGVAQNLTIENIKFTSDSVFSYDGNFKINLVDVKGYGYGTDVVQVFTDTRLFVITHVSLTAFDQYGYIIYTKKFEALWPLEPWVNYEHGTNPLPPYNGYYTYSPKFNYVIMEFK